MKKYLKTSLVFTILALVAGVFYREFTKWNGFTGTTTLAFMHTHFFVLGTGLYLFVALFIKAMPELKEQKAFKVFDRLHPIALVLFEVMLLVRGIVQVLALSVSEGMVAGIAGITHILLLVSLVSFGLALVKSAKD